MTRAPILFIFLCCSPALGYPAPRPANEELILGLWEKNIEHNESPLSWNFRNDGRLFCVRAGTSPLLDGFYCIDGDQLTIRVRSDGDYPIIYRYRIFRLTRTKLVIDGGRDHHPHYRLEFIRP